MPRTLPHDLAAVLRRAIEQDGRTQYRLAADSGVPQPVLSRFLTAKRDITLETATKLARVLGLELRAK